MTARSEGRIIADNPSALLALLRDDSTTGPNDLIMNQEPEKKVYVDWPENEDDDDFRFVSSRIDDIPDPESARITPVQYYDKQPPPSGYSDDRYKQQSSESLNQRRGSYTVEAPKTVPSASKYARDQSAQNKRNESFVINDSRSVPSASKYPNSANRRDQSFVVNDSRSVPSASKYPDAPERQNSAKQIRNGSFVINNPKSVHSADRYDNEPFAGARNRSRNQEPIYDSLDGPPSQQYHNQLGHQSNHNANVDPKPYDSLDEPDNHQIVPDNFRNEDDYRKQPNPYDSLEDETEDLEREIAYQQSLKSRIETNSSLLQSPVPKLDLNRLETPRERIDEETQPLNVSVRSVEKSPPRIIGAVQRDSLDFTPPENFQQVGKAKHIASHYKNGYDSSGMESYRNENIHQAHAHFENDNRYEEVGNREEYETERVGHYSENEHENPFVLPDEHMVDFDKQPHQYRQEPVPPFVHQDEQIPYTVVRDDEQIPVDPPLSSRELVNDLAAYQSRRVAQPRVLHHDDSYAIETTQGRPPLGNDSGEGSHRSSPRMLENNFVNKNIEKAFQGKESGSYAQRLKSKKETAKPIKRSESFNKSNKPLPGIKGSNSVGSVPDHLANGNPEMVPKPSSAEEMWNKRAQQHKGLKKGSGKRAPQGSGTSQVSRQASSQYSSSTVQSFQSQPLSQYSNQTQAVSQYSNQSQAHSNQGYQSQPASQSAAQSYASQQSNPNANPSYNYQVPAHMVPHVDAKPVLSEDGKTISVDVNLRLMSPNSGRMIQSLQLTSPTQKVPVNGHNGNKQAQAYYSDPYRPNDDFLSPRQEEPKSPAYRNPFPPLPPIHNPTSDRSPQTEQEHDEGYLAQFKKAKQPKAQNIYTPYTLKDYKNLQREIKLAGLGPDLDNSTHKEKLEKKLRQQEYARQILERQRFTQVHVEQPVHRPPRAPETKNSPSAEKRQKAMDYAKNLQRPRSRSLGSQSPASSPKVKSPQRRQQKPKPKPEQPEYIDLQRLLNQHERDKENVAAIRGNMKSMESPA